MTEPSKRDQRKARNREAIKEAALELARDEGWSAVSIRKIADKILYTAPVVYEHFKNKDDLYRHLVQDGFDALTHSTFAAMEEVEGPEAKILAMAKVRFAFAERHATLHHLMFDADNPSWQRLELIKSMATLKDHLKDLLTELTGQPERSTEYFMNLVCLVKGYTFFNMRLCHVKSIEDHFLSEVPMEDLFLNAIKRFLASITADL